MALLDALERERSGWSRVALGQALVHDLNANTDAALAKYRQAVDLGDSNPDALRRLMMLLGAKGRFAEVQEVHRRLSGAAAADPEVQRVAAEASLRTDNPKQALELAVRAVPEDSANPQDHLWLGQVAWAAGDRAKAEARFRKAVALRPDALDGWLILVRFLAAADRKDDAATALDEARAKVAAADRALLVALGSAQLGKVEEAAAAFRQARSERPGDLRTTQAEAEFLFQSGDLGKAQEAFRRIVDMKAASAEDKEFAYRMLALALAADRDYATSRQALKVLGLLEGDALRPPTGNESPAERRTRATVLALQRDRASKLRAVELLAGLGEAATPADLFLLAQLHHAVGDRPRVRVVMADLLRKADKVPLYVAFYADWLLRDGDAREAEVWVKRLEAIQPDALPTAELKARLLAARKDLKSARAVLVPRAEAPGAPVGRIARVCEEVGLYEDAERLFRQYAEQNRVAQPRAVLAVAAFYGRRGRAADALRVCAEVRPALPAPAWGEVAVHALYAAPALAAADAAEVAGWLEEAAKAPGPHRAAVTQLLASVRNLQGDYRAAMALYREAIAADPRDALAMNNLAYLLSAQEGKHDDALRLLEQAKRVIGPVPDLLDTEALVLLNKGEAEAARKLLEAVVAEAPSGPAYFHLARAGLASKRDLEARVAWRRAAGLGLRPADLHPLERPEYERLAGLMK
jgi:tetratricopeptide (TPR) repeat protein